jgi:antitoxin ParD1/3/4
MNINVSLTDELAKFIEAQVATGRYGSSSEVVQEALRLMERFDRAEAEKLRWLQNAWHEGIDSGDAGEIDFADFRPPSSASTSADPA